MSFREKILWATLLSGIASYGWYFGTVAVTLASGSHAASLSISGLVTAILVGLVLMIVVVSAVAIWNRRSGSMMPDEREHQIEKRGFVISYHLLCAGVLLTLAGAWWGWTATILVHVLTFMFLLAELTRVVVEIYGLRRGY
jgi:hypothetical protein